MFCFFRHTKEYDLSANENDADKDDEQNDENLVKIVDEEKLQLRLQNDWIARSLTSIGNQNKIIYRVSHSKLSFFKTYRI